MSDDLLYEHTDATLADVVQAMIIQMERENGQQFYAYQIGKTWAIFWNGPVYIH